MAKIVEHTDNGRPVITEAVGTVMDAHKGIVSERGWSVASTLRMSTGCVKVEYRTSKGMRTLYIWP